MNDVNLCKAASWMTDTLEKIALVHYKLAASQALMTSNAARGFAPKPTQRIWWI
jgi:hypothetical protein